MNAVVVDTNVAIVANGRGTHADLACQAACVERLRAVVAGERVVVDEQEQLGHRFSGIIAEYAEHLNHAGAPGVGDAFFKHVFDNQYQPTRCLRVELTPSTDDRGFSELPPNSLDPSDRKFLAAAVVSGTAILNATDSDWMENAALLNNLSVKVHQLCPQHAAKNRKRNR